MPRSATITLRVDEELKRRLQERAEKEHRSLSAQIEHDLLRFLEQAGSTRAASPGSFLGAYAGSRVPEDSDFEEVRRMMWGRLGGRG